MVWPHRLRAVGPLFPQCFLSHLVVFALTFSSYALYHTSRKTFSNIKMTIIDHWMPFDPPRLPLNSTYPFFLNTMQAILVWGYLDTIFLFSYALGLYITGVIGKWISLRLVLAMGMCFSGLVSLCFGTLTKFPYFYNKWFYYSMSVLTGLLESTSWPCVVAIMDSWFGITHQGFVFGLWSACASTGNILGVHLSSLLLQYGYEYTFFVIASMQLGSGLIIFFTLWILPQEPGPIYAEPRDSFEEDFESLLMYYDNGEINHMQEIEQYDFVEVDRQGDYIFLQPEVFSEAFSVPGVLLYSLANASRKLVNCSFFLWLPFYMNRSFGWGKVRVSQFSVWYDIEGILDGTFQGFPLGMLHNRSVLAVCVLLAFGSLIGYHHSSPNKIFNALLMTITGLFIAGPSDIRSFAILSDLGFQEQMRVSREALATVIGIIDSTVSMGTTLGLYLVSLIQDKLGWMWLFYFLALMSVYRILLISILLLREIRDFVQKKRTLYI